MSDASTQAKGEDATNGHHQPAKDDETPGKPLVKERRILPALKSQTPGLFSTLFGVILFLPLKFLALVGLYTPHKRALYLSGQPLIDGSPLKPLSEDAPEKRKHRDDSTEEDEEDDDDEEEMQGVEEDPYKYLREGVEYDSQEDEDYKLPPDAKEAHEDSVSDEFQEGDTDEDDINVDPKDIIKGKTRRDGVKKQGESSSHDVITTGMKGEERPAAVTLDSHAKNEEKAK